MPDDERWLRHTFALAEKAVELGDYSFGAALVGPDDNLWLESAQSVARTGKWLNHAELTLLLEAANRWGRQDIAECTLYSSTEPCPMCSGAIAWSVNRLVYGLSQARMYELYSQSGTAPRFIEPWSCRALLAHVMPAMEVVGPLLEAEAEGVHLSWMARNQLR